MRDYKPPSLVVSDVLFD